MARIRTVKPEFFRHYELFKAEKNYQLPLRIAFEGLWTSADREGRFRWRPTELKLDSLPYDDLDFDKILDALLARGFIKKYKHEDDFYGFIPSWHEHQRVNAREASSKLPDPSTCTHVHARVEGKGRERKGKEHKDITPLKISGEAAQADFSEIKTETIFIKLILQDKTEYPITHTQIEKWKTQFPGVEVKQSLRKMQAWCEANIENRKTRKGILKFAVNWLSREQDRPKNNGGFYAAGSKTYRRKSVGEIFAESVAGAFTSDDADDEKTTTTGKVD